MGGEPGCVANRARLSRTCWYCNSGRVLPWLIVRWRSRPVVQPVTQAKPRMKETRTSRMNVSEGDERTVYTGFIGERMAWTLRIVGDLNSPIALPLSPLSSPPCCGRHARNAAAGTETALTRRGQRWSGRRSPGWILPSGDAIQAGEVVHAEVASRVLDQSLAPHLDQFGADHGAGRADEFRQVLMA